MNAVPSAGGPLTTANPLVRHDTPVLVTGAPGNIGTPLVGGQEA